MIRYAKLARLDLKFDVWTLVIPCWWGFLMALTGGGHDVAFANYRLLLITLGAILVLGIGATYDDIMDRRIDAKVGRTRDRLLVTGEISLKSAWIFLLVQASLALAVLFQFTPEAILAGCIAGAMLLLYPFLKRFTHFASVYLGFMINAGALVICLEMKGALDWTGILTYLSLAAWTCYYQEVYCIQDRDDDIRIGVKSVSVLLGRKVRLFLYPALLLMLAFIMMAAWHSGIRTPYFYVLVPAAWLLFIRDAVPINVMRPQPCGTSFHNNRRNILVMTAAMLAGVLSDTLSRFYLIHAG